MPAIILCFLALVSALATATSSIAEPQHPGCQDISAKRCVDLALNAMGGRESLSKIANEQLDIAGHRLLTEQSYRQEPFINAYDRTKLTLDFVGRRQRAEVLTLWPESDPGTSEAESKSSSSSVPTTERLELGPERLLLTAEDAPDLHFVDAETLRSTSHTVVAFNWNGRPVKILINRFNYLPDAVEATQSFDKDFWFAWGDVVQRVYYDNWKLIGDVVYPTNRIEERNGIPWRSTQVLDAKFNIALDEKALTVSRAAAGSVWENPFNSTHPTVLAPGIDLYEGSWNVSLIRQDDGVVVLEAPISPTFTRGVLAAARAGQSPSMIKAVLTTSDSWPHMAGVRQAVAERVPVYALDLNRPILERLINAPHELHPDQQQAAPQKPRWRWVSGKTEIGRGPNRIVLYPLRGAATERQYMVYFPEHRLLYASDTLVVDSDKGVIYNPELTREVMLAVDREHLNVDQIYAMHQAPMAWSEVIRMMKHST